MAEQNLTEEEKAQIKSVGDKIHELMLKYQKYTALMLSAEEGMSLFTAGIYLGSALELSEDEAAKRDEVLANPFEE